MFTVFRVLKEVDFERKFEELPKFNPDTAVSVDAGTPLPSPRDIVNSYRKKRKQSIGWFVHTLITYMYCTLLTKLSNEMIIIS